MQKLVLDNGEQKANNHKVLFGDSPQTGLVGIARLAAVSEVLEAKRVVRYFDLEAKSVLNQTRPGLPFDWSLNPYRGCEFACRYCYARYSHEFMELRESADFEDMIFAKSGVGLLLRRELKKLKAGSRIGIGSATDPYQPAERRYGRTREALEAIAGQNGLVISIITKSDLVTRDIPLFREVMKGNSLRINITVTTVETDLARMLEPRAPRPELRLKAVRRLADAGIPVGVFPNPIMPGITDQETRLDALARASAAAGAQWFSGGVLFLMPCSKKVFFPFVAKNFPHLLRRYEERYAKAAYVRGPYRDMIRTRVDLVRQRHRLASSATEPLQVQMESGQEQLFDL